MPYWFGFGLVLVSKYSCCRARLALSSLCPTLILRWLCNPCCPQIHVLPASAFQSDKIMSVCHHTLWNCTRKNRKGGARKCKTQESILLVLGFIGLSGAIGQRAVFRVGHWNSGISPLNVFFQVHSMVVNVRWRVEIEVQWQNPYRKFRVQQIKSVVTAILFKDLKNNYDSLKKGTYIAVFTKSFSLQFCRHVSGNNAGRLFTLVGNACSVLSQDGFYKGILENSFIRVM